MEYAGGLLVGLGVAGLPALTGIGRGRDFYPVVLIVVAFYYVLFAAMAGSGQALLLESLVAAGFVVAAVTGFRTQPWSVPLAIAGHGLFDVVHHLFIENPGVPPWWPGFCATADLVIGALLALQMATKRRPG